MSRTAQREPGPSPALAPPPGNPRFPLVDSLRGIAVLSVVVYHVTGITGAMNDPTIGKVYAVLGNQGVVIFFILSGFLLYRPYAAAHATGRPRPSAGRYARRRALRILPAYWTALTILAVAPGVIGVFSGDWWRYYFFLQNYSHATINEGIPPAWTLAVEASFYAVLPAWALALRGVGARLGRRRWLQAELLMVGVAAAVGVFVQVAASRLLISNLLATTLLGECAWFALGMALAVLSVEDQRRSEPRLIISLARRFPGLCWIGAAACLLGVAAVVNAGGVIKLILSLSERQPYLRTLGNLVLTGGLGTLLVAPAVFGHARGGFPQRILAWRWLAALGLISYGVYLYHLTFAELIGERADPSRFTDPGLGLVARAQHLATPALLVLTLAASVAAATLSYRFVELPFLRLKER